MQNILIKAKASISSVGHESEQIWQQYKSQKSALSTCCFNDQDTPTGKLKTESEALIKTIRKEDLSYRRLDKSVLFALWAGREVKKCRLENFKILELISALLEEQPNFLKNTINIL